MDEVEAFLQHHGIKGMKWGIRNEDPLAGRHRSSSDKSTDEEIQSDQLRRKYGPYTGQDQKFQLSPLEKKIAIGVGAAVLLGGGAYLAKKHLDSGVLDIVKKQAEEVSIKDLHPGLAAHWEKGVDLPKGSIFQRLSTVKETEIRPNGFFAAFDPADVERYKAELPSWWRQWGYKEKEGYLVKLKAVDPIKAPSGKETIELYKSFLSRHPDVKGTILKGLNETDSNKALDRFAKDHFSQFAMQWANGYDQHPDIQGFFKYVTDNGFNALIDFNDSGSLAKTPMRLLDGADFQIAGHEFVDRNAIKTAQDSLKELVMAAISQVDEFLEHHGVKGMKWGIRKKNRGYSGKHSTESKRRNKILEKAQVHGGHSLTNKELADFNKRAELEQRFMKLNEEPPKKSKIKTGHAYVKEVLAVGATLNAAILFGRSPAGRKIAAAMAKNASKGAKTAYNATKTSARHTPIRPLALGPG